MTTLTRETKKLQDDIARVLDDFGVNYDDSDILQRLVAVYPTVTGTPRPNVQEYRKFNDKSNERNKKIKALMEIMPDDIGITPLNDSEWKYVLGQISDMIDKGWEWSVFANWFKSGNDFNRPKAFQISKKPKMLIEIYRTAFVKKSEPTFVKNEDGSLYV